MSDQSESVIRYFMRRFGWSWAVCLLLGIGIGFLRAKSPAGFRLLEIGGGIVGILLVLFYLSCLFQKRLTLLERMALLVAAFGAGIVAGKLFFPETLPLHLGYYLIVGFVCVFVLNPILEHFGHDPTRAERRLRSSRLP